MNSLKIGGTDMLLDEHPTAKHYRRKMKKNRVKFLPSEEAL